MFYGIYETGDSDTPGRFTQGNKHYDPNDKYEDQIRALGQKFVKANISGLLSPDRWYAPDGVITERSNMEVSVSKTTIKAGGNDFAVIAGAPKDVSFRVYVWDSLIWPQPGDPDKLPDGVLDFSAPAPGLYRIVLEQWPYRQFTVTIEATA